MNLKPIKDAVNLITNILSITMLAGMGLEFGRRTAARYDDAFVALFKKKDKKEEA